MPNVKAIPEGYATITPSLVIDGAAEAIELYKKAFGATEDYRVECPDSKKIMHAALTVGSSKLFLADPSSDMGCAKPTQCSFYLYVPDVNRAFQRAREAGMAEKSALQDMFYGDRTGAVTDKFGNMWCLATHIRDVNDADIKKAMKEMASKAA